MFPPKSPKSVYHNICGKKLIQTILKCPKKAFSNWFHIFNFTTADVWWSIDRRQFKTCLMVVIPISFQTSVTQCNGGRETDVICRQLMYSQTLPIGPTQIILRRSQLFVLCPSDCCLPRYWPYSSNNLPSQLATRSNKSEKETTPFLQFLTNSILDLSKSAFFRCNQTSTVWTTMYDQLLFTVMTLTAMVFN